MQLDHVRPAIADLTFFLPVNGERTGASLPEINNALWTNAEARYKGPNLPLGRWFLNVAQNQVLLKGRESPESWNCKEQACVPTACTGDHQRTPPT